MVLTKAWKAITALVAVGALSACATQNGTTSSSTGTSGTGGESSTGTGGTGTGGDVGTGGTGGDPNTPVCGDGKVATVESCDDGNTKDGDGCSATCDFEMGWSCKDEPTKCTPICGDGKLVGKELDPGFCDDGNIKGGDGCTPDCTVIAGWECKGAPSVCTTPCGDGIIAGQEECDDMNTAVKDGCSDTCTVEPGFVCVMVPSKCSSVCGDGHLASDEECDDNDLMPGDGCSDTCKVETYWTCMGEPSVCETPCGDGIVIAGAETCDDGNTNPGDGCSPMCAPEPGYVCMGEPSACNTVCGDGIVVAGLELCDDGNAKSGDGCNVFCKKEPGWICDNAMPTQCHTVCGDGYPAGDETCDDMNLAAGDGCGPTCVNEHGYICFNIPSVCSTVCGDGLVGGAEACDDGNANPGDGCSATCTKEVGFNCAGEPSMCTGICGDGIIVSGETCDDGNLTDGDCCSSTCGAENGCEIEPNNEAFSANDYAVIAVNNIVKGFVKPGTDSDFYVFTLNVPANAVGAITASTLDGFVAASCANNTLDSAINIYDQNANSIASDNDSGPGLCSVATVLNLQTGDYYIEVKSGKAAGQTPFDYTLQILGQVVVCGDGTKGPGEQCDDGNLVNGDGCDSNCKTTGCGNGIVTGAEVCDDGNVVSGDGCDSNCKPTGCGNGAVSAGENCDDGNVVSGDGCSATCQLEVISEIEPNDTPAQATANGAFTTSGLWSGSINPATNDDYFMITLAQTVDLKIETFDGNGPVTCTGIDTLLAFFAPNGTSQLASDDDDGPGNCSLLDPAVATDTGMRHLLPGNYFVRVKAFSSVIPAYTVRLTFTAICGNGIKEGFEECDGPGGPACDVNCSIIPVCGDGIVKLPETCDDNNLNNNDGCSSTCATEPNYVCVGAPSVCTQHENVCNDGMDNDGDGLVDCFDPDCQGQAVCVILPCAAGQTQHIYNSIDTPKPLVDLGTITSIINVPDAVTVNRAIVKFNITHTFDADLDIFLASPMGTNVELTTDNGSLNDNYTNTVFDDNCMVSITAGTAPFSGCFKPEGLLSSVANQSSSGNWTLTVTDDAGSDTGNLLSWNLVLCTTP